MKYENPQPTSVEVADRALNSSSDADAAAAVIGMALNESNRYGAERVCLKAIRGNRQAVRAAGITGLGHIARLHRDISPDALSLLTSLREDPRLGGIVDDAIDDIFMFVPHPKPE